MYRGRIKKIHFIGIGGIGMSGIAEVLLNMGYAVSGSDLSDSDTVKRLKGLGAAISKGHKSANVSEVDCVVYSSAVRDDNPEVIEAELRQIPVIPRAEMLAELMRMKFGVVVAGTHGKTTTTSLIAAVLAEGGIDPTIVNGGRLNSIGTNARLGTGDYIVAEADESDGSFLKLSPTIAVVTNIDREHMDHYADMEDVKWAFLDFINKVPFYGCAVICLDHPVLQGMMPDISRRVLSYGLTAQADISADNISQKDGKSHFDLSVRGEKLGRVTLNLPGLYNIYNSLASVAVAIELDMGFDSIRAALEGFKGVHRRFEVKGEARGIMVVDDYGHHPVEIKAVLKAAKDGWKRRSVVVFQPHRYSRTADMVEEFGTAFNDADKVIITDIYGASEDPIEGISGELVHRKIREHGHKDVTYIEDIKDIPGRLREVLLSGDMVITLGAGNIWRSGEELLTLLKDDA